MADWTNETILQFLELYESKPVIWNPKHRNNKNKTVVNNAWLRIEAILEKPVHELKKKKECLMATFKVNLKRKKASMYSGAGVEDIFKPTWFAYEFMERFLGRLYDVEPNYKTEENEIRHSQRADEINTESSDDDLNNKAATSIPIRQIKTQPFQGPRRRSSNPPELQEANRQMKQAFNTLNNILKHEENNEDECELFGRLLAKKLRRFSHWHRAEIMYEIDGMLLNRTRRPSSHTPSPTQIVPNRHSSTHSSKSTPIHIPVQIFIPDHTSPTQTSNK